VQASGCSSAGARARACPCQVAHSALVVLLLRRLTGQRVLGGKQLGDLTVALDELSKELVCEMTGKDSYEFGDLSKVIDTRCGRECA